MRIESNITTFARGGGCFLQGTMISTPTGDKPIERLRGFDRVMSYNEETKTMEVSRVGELDVLEQDHYYIINGETFVTGEHPFYTSKGIKKVKDLKMGDKLIGMYDEEITLSLIERVESDVIVFNLLDVTPNNNYYANGFLVHNKGGARSSGVRSSSSSSKSTTSKPSTTKSTTSTSSPTPAPSPAPSSSNNKAIAPPAPKPGVSKLAPGSAVKTTNGKTVVSSTKKPTLTKHPVKSTGVVGDNGYAPRYVNGYTPPYGSVVYHREHDFVDYLPWIYLFGQSSPQNDQQIIIQPDGKEIQAQPVKEGMDGLVILNWFLLIVIVLAIIGGIAYLINKLTNKKKAVAHGW